MLHVAPLPIPTTRLIKEIRTCFPDLHLIYRFGSMHIEERHAESDIDLAVLLSQPMEPLKRWAAQNHLALLLHAEVDLVDLRTASTVMQAQVLRTGILLYESDPQLRALYEMRVLSAYAFLNEERRGILNDIQQQGRIYGG